MNYDRVKYFVKAAELLNFSEAARQMYITPQAFGRQITLFEEEIGGELFVRTKHKVTLTYEGEILYRHMAPLVDAIENEYTAMQGVVQKRKGKLNIGILSFLSRSQCISPIINEIYLNSSSIDFNTQMYEMKELIDAMNSGEIDLGITMMHEGLFKNDNYEAIMLLKKEAKLMVSLYHKWVIQDEITLEDMKNMDRIRFDIGHIDEDNPYINYPCKKDVIVSNYASMLNELERGKGYVIVSPDITEVSLSYNTKEFSLPGEPLNISLSLMYKKTEQREELLELIDRICDAFEL